MQIVLLANLTKRKKPTFFNLTKLESFIFRPHKLRILLLVNLTKRKKHMLINLTKLESSMFRPHKLRIILLVNSLPAKSCYGGETP
jgi:hypothetical protein